LPTRGRSDRSSSATEDAPQYDEPGQRNDEPEQYRDQYPETEPQASDGPSSSSEYPPYPGGPDSPATCEEVGDGPYSVPPGSSHDGDGDGIACE
jgi:hypothetical protein